MSYESQDHGKTNGLPDKLKVEVMERINRILRKVQNYLTQSWIHQKNLYDPARDDFEEVSCIEHTLILLQISKSEYEAALSISDDDDFQVHFKKPPNSCFVNNFFFGVKIAWKTNLDVQTVFNHYKVVVYMYSYLSKSDDKCIQSISKAVKDAF